MTFYTDMMVDVETGGLDASHSPILQISAVKFNYAEGTIGPMFDRCLLPAEGRFWDESTRAWWATMPDLYDEICLRAEDPAIVMADFQDFAGDGDYRFWAKPTSFDFPFIASYFNQFNLYNPFGFRFARDLNSFIAALKGGAEHVRMDHVPFVGTPHNALDDCIHQISVLFHAKEGIFA